MSNTVVLLKSLNVCVLLHAFSASNFVCCSGIVNKTLHHNCIFTDEEVSECGCIEEDKPIEELRQECYSLPQGFVWDTMDISDAKVVLYK